MQRKNYLLPALIAALALSPARSRAQYLGAGRRLPTLGEAAVKGPHFGTEFVAPTIHKWYAPRHLVESYVHPWYTKDSDYAREFYQRYVDVELEGDEWFDSFGTNLGRGWLVYRWNQVQSAPRGSQLLKQPSDPTSLNAYQTFFNRLVVAADRGANSSYRLMIGDELFTSFTPLTFYKPRFNGMRLDYSSDRYSASIILARPNRPNGGSFTDATNLVGGHAEAQVGASTRLGLTYVNAHNVQTKEDFASGNPFRGALTTNQNQALETLWVRIRDDSPAAGREGAVLFAHDIVLTDTSGAQFRGSEIGFFPFVEGGVARGSALEASGSEAIVLRYDLDRLDREGLRSAGLRRVRVELSVANDYRIEMASNLQTDGQGRRPAPVFLTVRRAEGNVRDLSNGTVLRLDYTLPTGNELIGFNWDLVDVGGLSLQGELVLNRRYGQYPSPNIPDPHLGTEQASAGYVVAAYQRFPWKLFFEAFSMDDDYSSSYWLTQPSGIIKFRDVVPQLYEFVDDDDDQNALPDWQRPSQPWSPVVWPGYDENLDFRYDHNQNDNLLPDYEEPFLRFRSDRPEFLFGLDLNHNGTIDRFENDDLPDYPYKRDHRGFNTYLTVHAAPELNLSFGHQRLHLISGEGRTHSFYFLGTWSRAAGAGRLRLFEHGLWIKDNIPDDLNQWVQPLNAVGRLRALPDLLPAQNSWKNVFYGDLEQRLGEGVRLFHRLKWEWLRQRRGGAELRRREGRRRSGFLGVINKAEWSLPLGLATVEPRFKSEFRRERPFSTRLPSSTVLQESVWLLWTQPLLAERVGVTYFPRFGRQRFNTELQTGLELSWVRLLQGRREEVEGDFNEWTFVTQLSNRVAYLGYNLVTRAGVRLGRRLRAGGPTRRTSLFFLTVHAGL